MKTDQETNYYLSLLPEIFQGEEGDASPVHRLITIIERQFGDRERQSEGFEGKLEKISDYFHPKKAQQDFLPWLASWVALVLRVDWTVAQQRDVLRQIIPLYKERGTPGGLKKYLQIYAGEGVTIRDEFGPFQVGVRTNSQVGVNTYIGTRPYFFTVQIAFDTPDEEELKKRKKSVEAVLEIEKPAHTDYKLNYSGPTFQVGVHSTIGTDTLI
jgi:phage tail-like protein